MVGFLPSHPQVQLLFRHFRQDHIFDRSYALGTNVNTRVQQMMKGVSMMAAFSTLSSREVLELTLKGKGLEVGGGGEMCPLLGVFCFARSVEPALVVPSRFAACSEQGACSQLTTGACGACWSR